MLESIAALIVLSISISALLSYLLSEKTVRLSSQRLSAQHIADRAEVERQGRGLSDAVQQTLNRFVALRPFTYDIRSSSASRASVQFNSEGRDHTIHARASHVSRGVLDKKLLYQEGVR